MAVRTHGESEGQLHSRHLGFCRINRWQNDRRDAAAARSAPAQEISLLAHRFQHIGVHWNELVPIHIDDIGDLQGEVGVVEVLQLLGGLRAEGSRRQLDRPLVARPQTGFKDVIETARRPFSATAVLSHDAAHIDARDCGSAAVVRGEFDCREMTARVPVKSRAVDLHVSQQLIDTT